MTLPNWMQELDYKEEKVVRVCTYCGGKTEHTLIKNKEGEEKECTCDECGSNNMRIQGMSASLM